MPPSVRRTVTSLGLWVSGALVAVAVGVLALSLINNGLASGAVQPVPLDGPVANAPPSPTPTEAPSPAAPAAPAAPASSGGSTAARQATGSPTPSATFGPPRQLASVGGTVIARCSGASAYLVSWSPAQGYELGDVHRGPARFVSAAFESGPTEVRLGVQCVAGIPEIWDGHHG
jgi:hypothetical protein